MSEGTPGQSMEDILSSIKRIITDEADAAPRDPVPAPVAEDDVLELGAPPPEPDALVSQPARDATRQALASLAGLRIDAAAPDNTLDAMVREMLRPMLKAWLDDNLPELVERIVAREVARLVGR